MTSDERQELPPIKVTPPIRGIPISQSPVRVVRDSEVATPKAKEVTRSVTPQAQDTPAKRTIAIGEDIQTGEKIYVSQDALYSGSYVIGVQGSGKTSILTTIGLAQMEAGDSVIVLDPTGDMIRDMVSRMPEERIQDTYMLSLKESKYPFSMSVFSYPQQTQGIKQLELEQGTRNQIYSAFEKLWPETRSGLYFKKILRNIIPILLDHPQFTLLHIPRFFSDAAFRQHILACMTNQDILPFWQDYSDWSRSRKERETQPFLDRIDELLSDEFVKYLICQKHGLIDIRQAIIERKNLLIHLPLDELPYKNAARTIGIFFMMQIYAATFSFANMPRNKRPGFTLLVDEFSKWAYGSGDEFRDLFSLGRKYGIKQVLCHQYLGQLDEENMGSLKQAMTTAHTVIALRTNRDDSPYLSHLFAGYEYEDYGEEEEEEDEAEEVFTRKPMIIDTEPTKEMKYHKDPLVRDFYIRYVAPLEVGATWGQNTLPRKYDFGFGQVYFEQTTIREILRRLNRLLYDTQVAGAINETALHTFVYETYVPAIGSYGQLPYDMVPDPEGLRKREEVQKQLRIAQKQLEVYGPEADEHIKMVEKAMAEGEEKIRQLQIQRKQNLKEWEQRYPKLYEKFGKHIYEYNLEGTYVDTDHNVWMIDSIKGGKITFTGYNYTKIADKIPEGHSIIKKLQKQKEDMAQKVRDLESQLSAIPTEKKVERTDVLVEAERILRRVLWALFAYPIAVDRAEVEREREKWEKEQERKRLEREKRRQEREEQAHKVLSASEVAGILPKLENRQAFVKIASEVYRMRTINLPAPVAWEEMTQRWNTILAQTKRTYCRGRKEVERELAEALTFAPALDQNASENGQASSTPQPDRIPPDKPSVAQPQPTKDLFDRLDEMRRE
jgi:hypothetical protein